MDTPCRLKNVIRGTATPMTHIDPVFNLRFEEYGGSSVIIRGIK